VGKQPKRGVVLHAVPCSQTPASYNLRAGGLRVRRKARGSFQPEQRTSNATIADITLRPVVDCSGFGQSLIAVPGRTVVPV
jgi:hypothetical protein